MLTKQQLNIIFCGTFYGVNIFLNKLLGSYFSCIGISFDKTHFTCNWIVLKWFLEYHEVYWINKTSSIIEDMKTAPRNKLKKVEKWTLILASIDNKWRISILVSTPLNHRALQIQNSQICFLAHDNFDY